LDKSGKGREEVRIEWKGVWEGKGRRGLGKDSVKGRNNSIYNNK
jgi:hypothetical protein